MDEPIRYVTFPESVMLRPKMYTLGGSYQEVVAFLEGHISGLAKFDADLDIVREWWSFREWLEGQFGAGRTEALKILLERHETNEAALEDLLENLRKYQSERSAQGKDQGAKG